MSLVVLLTWLAAVSIIVAINLLITVRHGFRTCLLPILLGFLPPMLFFPFSFDRQNILATGPLAFRRIVTNLPEAWMIFGSTALVAMLVVYWTVNLPLATGRTTLGFFGRGVTKLVLNDTAAIVLFVVQIILFVLLISSGFTYGAGTFSAFENTALRPVINFANALFALSVPLCLVRVSDRRSALNWIMLFGTIFMAGLSGQRSTVLFPLLIFALIYMSSRSIKFSIWPAIFALMLMPVAMVMADYRSTAVAIEGRAAPVERGNRTGLIAEFVYGNQFSDVRDMAWILSGYDGRLLMGRSYLAGATFFIPSRYWDYRRQWGLGDWTVRQAGLDPRYHSGLRGGFFSELYFNFGLLVALIGAAATGFVIGSILRHEIDHDRVVQNHTRRAAFALANYLKVALLLNTVLSPGFFGVPVILMALFLADMAVAIGPKGRTRSRPAGDGGHGPKAWP